MFASSSPNANRNRLLLGLSLLLLVVTGVAVGFFIKYKLSSETPDQTRTNLPDKENEEKSSAQTKPSKKSEIDPLETPPPAESISESEPSNKPDPNEDSSSDSESSSDKGPNKKPEPAPQGDVFSNYLKSGEDNGWSIKERSISPLNLGVFSSLTDSMSFTRYDEPISLPNHIRPSHYDLLITASFTDLSKFVGSVSIQIEFLHSSNFFVLNADGLDFDTDTKISFTTSKISYSDSVPSEKNLYATLYPVKNMQIFIVRLKEVVPAGTTGTFILRSFTGAIYHALDGPPSPSGFYNGSCYGKTLLYTHFKPRYARRAFPCFDEPEYKSTFSLTIATPSVYHLTVASNTEVIEKKDLDNITRYRFATTPVMSTYLLAWAIGDLDQIESITENNIPFRLLVPDAVQEGKKISDLCQPGLAKAVKAFNFFSDYFKTPLPLKKIDLIGIDGINFGMENWGLSGLPLSNLKDKSSSLESHEIAHYWFGNLVTMETWQDLWIKEGAATFFALYMKDKITSKKDSSSKVWMDFLSQHFFTILQQDSEPVAKKTLEDPKKLYSMIAYQKGATIYRILLEQMGEVPFQQFCQKLLYTFQYTTLSSQNFIGLLGDKSDLAGLVNTWVNNQGHPLVTVQTTILADNDWEICLTQTPENSTDPSALWHIPITVNFDSLTAYYMMKEKEFKFKFNPTKSFFKINPGLAAIFPIEYDATSLNFLKGVIREKKLPLIDSLGVLFNLCLHRGKLSPELLFEFFLGFKGEECQAVWVQITKILDQLKQSVHSDASFQKYLEHLAPKGKFPTIKAESATPIDAVESFLAKFNPQVPPITIPPSNSPKSTEKEITDELVSLVALIEEYLKNKEDEKFRLLKVKVDQIRTTCNMENKVNRKFAYPLLSREFVKVFLMKKPYDESRLKKILSSPRWKPWTIKKRPEEPLNMGVFVEGLKDLNTIHFLPNNVKPIHYDLHIIKNDLSNSFSGEVSIDIEFLHNSKCIVLNASNLDIKDKEFSFNQDDNIQMTKLPNAQAVMFTLSQEFTKGSIGTLKIKYSGIISNIPKGFHDSSESGKTLWTTHFETIYARQAFPCFDEPAYKATFSTRITTLKDFVVISNMPLVSEVTVPNESKCFQFAETPKMSTYLVAWSIGNLQDISLKSNICVKCYSLVLKEANKVEDTLKLASDTLKCLAKTFGKWTNPIKKFDLISVCKTTLGAMENWGLTTFNHSYILYRPLVIHEISHYLFGNLITMEWWNDVWLKEGFATFFETYIRYALAEGEAKTQVWLDYLSGNYGTCSGAAGTTKSSTANFGGVSLGPVYSKGGQIARMIMVLLGEEQFKFFLQRLLYTFQYSNLTTRDFLDTLKEEDNGTEIANDVESWVYSDDLPNITASSVIVEGKLVITLKFTNIPTNMNYIPINLYVGKPEGKVVIISVEVKSLKPGQIFIYEQTDATFFK
jgi:aminopeptidase N